MRVQRTIHARNLFRRDPVYHIAVVQEAGSFSFSAHSHEGFAELVFVRAGALRHTVGGHPLRQGKGDLAFIREHDVHALAGSALEMVNVAFPVEHLERVAVFLGDRDAINGLVRRATPPTVHQTPAQAVRADAVLRSLFTQYGQPGSRRLFGRFLVDTLVDGFWAAPPIERKAGLPDWLAAVLAQVERALEKGLTVPDLARIGGRTPEHVARTFRRYLQTSPSQYLNERRLERARLLLGHTNYPIIDICYRVGFNNLSYFYRLFRRRYGRTPREHRRQAPSALAGA